MRRWYSPRGARRGLILAGFTAVLWFVWAIGYAQGIGKVIQPSIKIIPTSTATTSKTFIPVNTTCCLQHLDI